MSNNGKTYHEHRAASRALAIINQICCEDKCGKCEGGRSDCKITVAELMDLLESRKFKGIKPISEFKEEEVFDDEDDRYPSEYFLVCLSCFDAWNYLSGKKGLEEFLDVIRLVWECEGLWEYNMEEKTLEISTGGWSGNEDILSALSNTLFYMMCLESEHRGGHVKFDLSRFKWSEE